jgi:uncharacterized protein YecT (DUF1311 family)
MKTLLLLTLLLFPAFTYAQESHPIDKALDACTEKDPSTAGAINCTDIAHKQWEGELNKNYLALMRKLSPANKSTLKTTQLNWLKYRDTEFKLIDAIYDKLQGTMYIPMRLDQKMQIVRRRTLALSTYLELTKEFEP